MSKKTIEILLMGLSDKDKVSDGLITHIKEISISGTYEYPFKTSLLVSTYEGIFKTISTDDYESENAFPLDLTPKEPYLLYLDTVKIVVELDDEDNELTGNHCVILMDQLQDNLRVDIRKLKEVSSIQK